MPAPAPALPAAPTTADPATTGDQSCRRSPFGIFDECPHCAGAMRPEHAHYRCVSCGWRDSCCD